MVEPRKPLGEGAAQEAPTAPHATPRTGKGPATGPERFWAPWPVRIALAAGFVVSGVAHCAVVPFDVPHGFELKDVEGEAAIPIDILPQDEPATLAPPPAPAEAKVQGEDKAQEKSHEAAMLLPRKDAGTTRDAAADAPVDAADAARDAADASSDGPELDGAYPLAEAGVVAAAGPRDPQAILGAAGSVQADVVLVMVVVNAEVIRQHAVGARMGYLLRGIPQWDEFMSGTEIDPVRDTDWVMISGPSLINSSRDVVMIHYSAPDAVVDKAIAVVSHKYDRGGAIDAGVPGVRATLAHADRAERVLLRPQPRVLAVVPPSVAGRVARQLVASKVPAHIRPGEAMYLRLVNPHHPMPEIPEALTELRMRVVPRSDQGADVFIDCDAKDAAAAESAAQDVRAMIRRHDDWITASLTHGLLDHVDVSPEGAGVRVHLTASRDQIEALVALVGDFLGVKPGGSAVSPSPGGGGAPPPK
jgi:hypothetical protein